MVDWQGAKPGTFVNNSTVEPVSAENLNAIVNTVDKIATGGKDSGVNADTIRDIDFDALATTSDENLTNFYSFDLLYGESNEVLLDDSGLNYHGTAYNISLVKGLICMAGSFNGISSYASCPYTNRTSLTLALWYKGVESTDKPLFILKRANNAVKIGIFLSSGHVCVKFFDSDSVTVSIVDTDSVCDGLYHHIAVTHTGTSCHLYVDGNLKQSLNQTLTALYYNQAIIGASEEAVPVTFTAGTIDDVRIYSSALSQLQIYGLYFNKINTKVYYKPTITDIPTLEDSLNGKASTIHYHDDRYYTESEVTTLLAGKAASSHNHDGTYFTESEVTTLLAGKAASSHTHDDRYFTESEITTQMSGKASSTHNHDSNYANLGNYNAFHDWSSSKTYALNEPCFYQGVPYKSLVASNLNKTPSSNPTSWQNMSASVPNIWASVITQVGVNANLPIGFSTVESDAYGLWNATNKRFTISVAGRWRVSGAVKVGTTNTIYIYKNGVKWRTGSSGSQGFNCVADIMSTFAVGDYVDIRTEVGTGNEDFGHFQIEFIR